jgi:imidazolonepropionase-like amidohydrolase
MELLVEAGLSPYEALQAATRNPAMFLGESKDWGTVEKGKLANLVLLSANPLVDIRNSQKIDGVMLMGRYLSKSELDSMLAKAEAAAAN